MDTANAGRIILREVCDGKHNEFAWLLANTELQLGVRGALDGQHREVIRQLEHWNLATWAADRGRQVADELQAAGETDSAARVAALAGRVRQALQAARGDDQGQPLELAASRARMLRDELGRLGKLELLEARWTGPL